MATVLLFLTFLAIILLIGLLVSILSNKLRVSHILLLLIVGIFLGKFKLDGEPIIYFPTLFLTAISILALVMIVFDSSSRFKLRFLDYFYLHTLWLSVVFLIFNLGFLGFFAYTFFDMDSFLLAFAFAALMSGTDPAAVISMFKKSKHKVIEFLKLESLLNTPLIVLLPFIIIDLKTAVQNELLIMQFIDQIIPFLQQFIAGIGSGVLVGLIMFKFMRRQYSSVLSPLAMITAALLTYALAENLQGNGVLAVTTMGILFGSIYVKHKDQLQEFSSVFSNSLEILVFVLIGLVISFPLSLTFILKSLLLFVIYIFIRFIAILFSLRGMNFTIEEKLFMALNVQKGLAVAVVVLSLAGLNIPGIDIVLNLSLAFMIYSIILSTLIMRIIHLFIKLEKV